MDIKKTRILSWVGDLPSCGEYFKTKSGRYYAVLNFTPTRGDAPKSVGRAILLKLTPDDVVDIPQDAIIHGFSWTS